MAKMMVDNMETLPITGTTFGFSATRLEKIGASEITLVTIAVDESSSVGTFRPELVSALRAIVNGCKKSPRADNLLVRVIAFSNDVREVHGFKLLQDISGAEYDSVSPHGMTALNDAAFSAVAATATYGKTLLDQDFLCNAIVFIITDGCENHSKNVQNAADIAEAKRRALSKIELESFLTVLVGVNIREDYVRRELMKFEVDGEFDAFEEVENATPESMAKLAGFASRSISSQSQALGTGGPSQVIPLALT